MINLLGVITALNGEPHAAPGWGYGLHLLFPRHHARHGGSAVNHHGGRLGLAARCVVTRVKLWHWPPL